MPPEDPPEPPPPLGGVPVPVPPVAGGGGGVTGVAGVAGAAGTGVVVVGVTAPELGVVVVDEPAGSDEPCWPHSFEAEFVGGRLRVAHGLVEIDAERLGCRRIAAGQGRLLLLQGRDLILHGGVEVRQRSIRILGLPERLQAAERLLGDA